MSAQSKAHALDSVNNGIVGSNSIQGMDVCMYFSIVLSCVCRGFTMDQSLIQGVLLKCQNRFIVSEVNSELEQTKELNL